VRFALANIMKSIFTKIIRMEERAHVVWNSNRIIAILDICPINPGHLLVIPYEEVSDIDDLTDERYHELWRAVKHLRRALQSAFGAPKVGIAVEGFGVDHAHIHLVPVYSGNELNPERAKPASVKDLDLVHKKILAAIQNG